MEFGQKLAERARRTTQVQPQEVDFRKSIVQNLGNEEVIPIISGNIRLEQIFRNLPKESTVNNGGEDRQLTVVETLVRYWAQSIGYPMEDDYNLARVFQYELVRKLKELKDEKVTERDIDKITRNEIVDFLKNSLLTLSSDDPDYLDVVEGLSNQMRELSFSEMARQLDYPRYDKTSDDSIRILARLPIKFFITSGQSDFLERALMAENKDPHTHVCFWSGEPSKVLKEHIAAKDYKPTVEQPMVYHLFGLEIYPETLVLSEDDYISFLISIIENTNNQEPIIPLSLRQALGESQLLFLGYRLYDWDFRVLFRLILKFRLRERARWGMVMQLEERERELTKKEKKVEYLKCYFDLNKFKIEWKDSEVFIKELGQAWNSSKRKQL